MAGDSWGLLGAGGGGMLGAGGSGMLGAGGGSGYADAWHTWTSLNNAYTTTYTWQVWQTVVNVTAVLTTNATEWVQWQAADVTPRTAMLYGQMPSYQPCEVGPWQAHFESKQEMDDRLARERETALAVKKAAAEALRKQQEAEAKSRELLESLLDDEQKADLAKSNSFLVDVKSGRKYRIKKARAGNLEVVDDQGLVEEKLCVHPYESVPDYDTMAAQLLWLRWNEDQLRKTANITVMRVVEARRAA